jgi:predicted DNA-binding transcriptional regulator YafY
LKVLKAGVWYLVAQGQGQARTYRVSRLLELTMLEQDFARPGDYDLAAYRLVWSARSRSSLYRGEATVRFSPRAQESQFILGPEAVRAVANTADLPDAEGWIRVVLPIESMRHAETDLLRFGAEAEVLDPPELRERLVEVAAAMIGRYRER